MEFFAKEGIILSENSEGRRLKVKWRAGNGIKSVSSHDGLYDAGRKILGEYKKCSMF